jgi:SAM-dependent methyltransferase
MNDFTAAVARLQSTTDALAAVGARLSIADGDAVAPEIVAALDDVLAALGLDVTTLDPQPRALLAGIIRTAFAQATDLLERPGREAGWTYTDPVLLNGQGRGSMLMPTLLATAPELQHVTSFLDLGTGVGLLAVAAAQVWPDCTVVGIDTWDPSLELAYANVKAAGLDDRIEIRRQDIAAVDDVDRFDCVWLPSFFFSAATLAQAMPRLVDAATPGGWIAVAHYEPPPDPLPTATIRLRTIRDGGAVIDAEAAADLLRGAGCQNIHPIAKTWPAPVGYVIGQKAAGR